MRRGRPCVTSRPDWPVLVGAIASQARDGWDNIGGQQRRVAGPLAVEGGQLHRRGVA